MILRVATTGDRPVLEALTQLYLHDMSAFFAGTGRLDLGEDGRFVVEPSLDRWFGAAGHVPMLVEVGGRPAGFALVNDHSVLGEQVDRAVAEFFVVRKYRRTGLGTAAARAVLSGAPGVWEAAVMRANAGAVAFWDAVMRGCPGVVDVMAHDRDDAGWNGTVFRLRVSPP